jgi:DNA-binding CsgD family transcriptional regulator
VSVQLKRSRFPELRKKEWLVEQYVEKGISSERIAEMVGCSGHTVRNWLRIYGIETSKRGLNPHTRFLYKELQDNDWLFQRYIVEGLTIQDIADEIGCQARYVHEALRELNFLTRPGIYAEIVKRILTPERIANAGTEAVDR